MAKDQGTLLIVDDDEFVLLSLRLLLEQHFSAVTTLSQPAHLMAALNKEAYDTVLLDMNFKAGETRSTEGIFWLRSILKQYPDMPVILITAFAEIHVAVEAIKEGALDFIVKPWQNEKLLATVKAACLVSREKKKVKQLRHQQKAISALFNRHFEDLLGTSPAIEEIRSAIGKVASTDASVLILGANGTGKEVVARALHRASARAEGVFLSVDLGSLSEQLFESELFGHKKGAFTDARDDRIGRFEAAHGGTLFLDEIANVPLSLQAKLLTVLQHKHITRLGTNEPVPVDVRIICATNADLKKSVQEGRFREDLLYRINVVEINIPPLAARREDIVVLSDHFLKRFAQKYQKVCHPLSEAVKQALLSYHWPGNVRELQHTIERAVILGDGHVSLETLHMKPDATGTPGLNNLNLEEIEAWAIRAAIAKHQGNISHAAEELGLSRGAMYRRMEKYGL